MFQEVIDHYFVKTKEHFTSIAVVQAVVQIPKNIYAEGVSLIGG
jgi:hypothetical protein